MRGMSVLLGGLAEFRFRMSDSGLQALNPKP